MRLVSDNSPTDIAAGETGRLIDDALRELASNLFRVTRGAGKPTDIESQVIELAILFDAYREKTGRALSFNKLADALDIRIDQDVYLGLNEENAAWADAEDDMVRGALQIAASRLLGQRTQETAGHSEMFKGLMVIEKHRERNWRRSNPRKKQR